MEYLKQPIAYLERSDFTDDGNLVPILRRVPTFVMFQAVGCGHCTTAKPAFQALANEGIIQCMTVQGDGERPSERAIVPLLPKILSTNRIGYPSYMLFINGKKIPYTGARDKTSMKNFIQGAL
jgi:thiol-disulfide isomerase/thioredoxin